MTPGVKKTETNVRDSQGTTTPRYRIMWLHDQQRKRLLPQPDKREFRQCKCVPADKVHLQQCLSSTRAQKNVRCPPFKFYEFSYHMSAVATSSSISKTRFRRNRTARRIVAQKLLTFHYSSSGSLCGFIHFSRSILFTRKMMAAADKTKIMVQTVAYDVVRTNGFDFLWQQQRRFLMTKQRKNCVQSNPIHFIRTRRVAFRHIGNP